MARPLVDSKRGPRYRIGNPFRLRPGHGGIRRPTGNPRRHGDFAQPGGDVKEPQRGQRGHERVGIVPNEVAVHAADNVCRNPDRRLAVGSE